MQQDILYYSHAVETNPKKNPDGWNEAMPLGNGSIGCMVYGAVGREKLQLNEDTIWHGGGGRNRVNPEAKEHYKGICTLLTEGRIKEAQREALLYMMPVMEKERSYSTAENIWLDFEVEEEYTNYRRILDLNRAVAEVSFECKGIHYKREYFVSAPHQMIVVHQKADKNGACNVVTDWRGNERIDEIKKIGDDILVLKNTEGGENACSYAEMVSVRAEGGKAFVAGGRLVVEHADELTIFITLRTDFYGDNPESWCLDKMNAVKKLSYEDIKQSHIEDYRKYYDRMSFRLGNCEDNKDTDNEDTNDEYKIAVNENELTIDERLKRVKNGHTDLKLISLYFNFGRYLMISCSRPGTQPANLQGIWNKDFYPA